MKTLLRSILFILLLISCIQSDLSDCPAEVRLNFEYTLNMANKDKLRDEVKDISMYVFDENDFFVQQIDYVVNDKQSITFDLDKGAYNIVVLGNVDEKILLPTLLPMSVKLSDFKVSLNDKSRIFQDSTSLFYAFIENLNVDDFGATREVGLRKNSKSIKVRLIYEKGFQSARSPISDLPEVVLSGQNRSFNYKNELLKEDEIDYLPFYIFNKFYQDTNLNKTDYNFSTFHLEKNIPLILKATNVAEDIFIIDLMDILNKTPIDLIREDLINISINFTNETLITIRINDWELYLDSGNIGLE